MMTRRVAQTSTGAVSRQLLIWRPISVTLRKADQEGERGAAEQGDAAAVMAGMVLKVATGSMTSSVCWSGDSPIARAASIWPTGTESRPLHTTRRCRRR
jgi:hypothetical protein